MYAFWRERSWDRKKIKNRWTRESVKTRESVIVCMIEKNIVVKWGKVWNILVGSVWIWSIQWLIKRVFEKSMCLWEFEQEILWVRMCAQERLFMSVWIIERNIIFKKIEGNGREIKLVFLRERERKIYIYIKETWERERY